MRTRSAFTPAFLAKLGERNTNVFKLYYTFASATNFCRYLMLSDLAKARYLWSEVQRREWTPSAEVLQKEWDGVQKRLDRRARARRIRDNWNDIVFQESERLELARNPRPIEDEVW